MGKGKFEQSVFAITTALDSQQCNRCADCKCNRRRSNARNRGTGRRDVRVAGLFGAFAAAAAGIIFPAAAKEAADAIDDVADDRDVTDAAAEEVVEEVADLFKEITKVW